MPTKPCPELPYLHAPALSCPGQRHPAQHLCWITPRRHPCPALLLAVIDENAEPEWGLQVFNTATGQLTGIRSFLGQEEGLPALGC